MAKLTKQTLQDGRTALHYTAACRDEAAVAALLERAGAGRGAQDAAGRTLAHYRTTRTRLTLPAADMPQAARNPPGLVFKRHNIRIWCHECDMGRLQRVVWEGHGTQLLSEVSSQPIVKRFLEAVPYIMNTIRDIHNAVIQNDLEGLIKLTADPVLPRVFSSRDINNMTALHKAAGLGHCGILKYIVEKYPQGINDVDNNGRTPLHYAATVKDEQHTYNTLVGLGADESVVDNRNKSPAYYVNRPQEIDKSTLKILPDAPRTPSSAYPTSWDWKLLDVEHTADINKKHRKKKASNENISSKNNTSTLSEPFENRINLMKGSSTHEHINTLPELDDTDKPNIPKDVEEENAKNIKASEVIEENNHEEVNVDKEKDTTIESLEFDKNLTAEAIDSENLQVPSTTDEKEIEDEGKSLLLNKEENNDEEKCDTKDIVESENENSTHNDTNEKGTEKERINEIEGDNVDHNIDENENESANPNEQVGNEQFKNDDSKETDGHKDSFNNEDQTNDKNSIDAMCDSEEQLDKDQEDITDINEHRTSNGEVRTEEQENESHDINSDMNVEDKKSVANGPEGNNNCDRNEDDDDVQVQEKLHIEHNGLNVTIRDQINNSSFGKQNYGRNTQESLIEGIISGDAEQDSQDASMTQKDGSVHGDILIVDNEIDPEVTDLINSANMEMLATLVLNGEGSRLIGRRSHNAELQAFLENVPTYMQKINRVHLAARGGNIRDLQTALDRRKFAIARDPISPNGATPLHVATVFGKTNIIKYLGGRFPETLSAVDFEGRTALHYAAVIPDNGHYYNLLQQLGANEKDLDDNGRSAKDYLNNPNLLPYEQLIADYGMSNEIAQNMLSDKVPEDHVSSRRDLDTPEALDILERCYRLLASARPSRTPLSASSNKATPPFVLGRFLKRSIFEEIRHRVTKLDHDLFDVIWPAVKKLPNNKNVVQTVEEDFPGGVTAPDYYVYEVFHEFLIPLVKDLHNINNSSDLPIHPPSDFDTKVSISTSASEPFIELNVDPSDEFVISGSIECSRNLCDFELPLNLKVGKLETVERIITTLLMHEKFSSLIEKFYPETNQKGGTYYTLNEVLEKPSEICATLAENGLLIALCDKEEIDDCTRLHGRHWPYGRGVFVSDDKTIAIWINVHDHLRVIVSTPSDAPGEIGIAYNKMWFIMSHLHDRLDFVWNQKIGYLSSRPTFLGVGIRFSLIVNFPGLSKDSDNMKHLCAVRGLQYRETLNADIARVSNYQCLSTTESNCFNDFATAVTNLLHLEKDLSMQNSAHLTAMLTNIFKRKRNSLAELHNQNLREYQ
ncbi:unnamed protein product [Parnassius apollo]|uniref:(apollo) hypothetical protein n=1 Tax=Parnassius apollo TaxID=110799 RepID=A0A8S3WN39_PARAO|nr:unnamed protein product [Parnassius apollo]